MHQLNSPFTIPTGDPEKRFIMGKCGKKNLLIIALNPNTADLDPKNPADFRHDSTIRVIEAVSKRFGYDV